MKSYILVWPDHGPLQEGSDQVTIQTEGREQVTSRSDDVGPEHTYISRITTDVGGVETSIQFELTFNIEWGEKPADGATLVNITMRNANVPYSVATSPEVAELIFQQLKEDAPQLIALAHSILSAKDNAKDADNDGDDDDDFWPAPGDSRATRH